MMSCLDNIHVWDYLFISTSRLYLLYNVMEIIDSFGDILRNYPALAVFLTVGMGFLLGRLRIGSFTLGSVTAVLLVGSSA